MLKLKMMLCVMMLRIGRRRLLSGKQSVSQWVKPLPPPAWIMQPPRLADTAERDYFTLRGWSLCKNNWKEPRSILMSSADRVAHIDGQLMQLLWAIHALPAEYKCLSNKTEQSIYECLLGFCFNNIFCAATNFGCIDSFLLPNSRNEEMMGDGFLWCYCCRFVWTVNVCWAHPVISRASAVASSIFFMVLFPMLFEVRRIVCVKIKQTLNNELKFHIVNIY